MGTQINWSKLRFEWKKRVNGDPNVSRGAKQFASFICDEFVERGTGQFHHRNDTMAALFGMHVRSIQRHLAELQASEWLAKKKVRGWRRTFQLAFRDDGIVSAEHDKPHSANAPIVSPEHDNSVTRYSNQVNNQRRSSSRSPSLSYVTVHERETNILDAWRLWLEANTDFDVDSVLEQLRRGANYCLPVKYPDNDARSRDQYCCCIEALRSQRKGGTAK